MILTLNLLACPFCIMYRIYVLVYVLTGVLNEVLTMDSFHHSLSLYTPTCAIVISIYSEIMSTSVYNIFVLCKPIQSMHATQITNKPIRITEQ